VTTCDFSVAPSKQRKERRSTKNVQSACTSLIDVGEYVNEVEDPDESLSQDSSPLAPEEVALLETLGMTVAHIEDKNAAEQDSQAESGTVEYVSSSAEMKSTALPLTTDSTRTTAWAGTNENSLDQKVVVEGEAVDSLQEVHQHDSEMELVDSLLETDAQTSTEGEGENESEGESESESESETASDSESDSASDADGNLEETNELAHAFQSSEEYPVLAETDAETEGETDTASETEGEGESESESNTELEAESEVDADENLEETNELAHAFQSAEDYPVLTEVDTNERDSNPNEEESV